ncbi:UbiH/UbiF family hydroxylase [Aquibium carbonis]|uniref:UbiH/UbiF family hydroxylase n=1 Tax=Aquibium carbonis TaxID=2495581 RepID=A0A429Z2D9_9HYPH|nr:UbiH/UbiF family hydroxylase [Aquibium carbonis]RST87800.1 UbiH/UbiF family hydroxylase [Aquibium carbonis]
MASNDRIEDGDVVDVIVAGAGPAGLIAALAFARAGFGVRLIGPEAGAQDRRTTALMVPSMAFLDDLGVREAIIGEAAPLRTMRIIDMTRRLVRSGPVSFHASEIGEDAFGWNVPNAVLARELQRAVSASPAITWTKSAIGEWRVGGDPVVAVPDASEPVSARLAVAADGRGSPAREAAGIRVLRHTYEQAALVFNFAHGRDHGFVSTEFHTETGPFTQVPLPGRRSSLVWVLRPERAEELAGFPDETLSALVEERMQSALGKVTVETGRQVYPLSSAIPVTFARDRIALVGEAAHVFPPIGAQGLNLGIRDVRDLVEIAARHPGDPGAPAALDAYTRRRRPDIVARTGAVHALNRSLLSDMLPAQVARMAGLGLLGTFSPLRAFFMREGLQPGSGFSAMFSGPRKQVGR